MKRKGFAALILSLLSPFFAEILSGSTPPMEAINPITFLSLWGFYGAGVLLFRELWVRKNPTVMGVMFMGFAYGILEEGVFVKSWFNLHWGDLGVLGVYGRVYGINTVWATWLTIFHAFMSIWVPIMVLELIFPDLKRERFFRKKSAIALISVYISVGIMMLLFLTSYVPPFTQWILTVFLAILFIYLGCKLKFPVLRENWMSRHSFLFGLGYMSLLFILFVILPYSTVPFPVPIILGIPLAVYFYWRMEGMNPRRVHLILLGSLSFWLLFMDFALEMQGIAGEFVFGIVTYILLLYLFKKRYTRIFPKAFKIGNFKKKVNYER